MRKLLWMTAALPALAFGWGSSGNSAFVLYREPKLIALSVLGWLLVGTSLWSWRHSPPMETVLGVLRRPTLLTLAAFLAYMATTGLWVEVEENHFYEANQYLLLFLLLILFLVAAERDQQVIALLRNGLITSVGLVTVVGLLQWFFELPALTPIDPEIGAPHPSFMGYKNPAALALLGQIFLLGEIATDPKRSLRTRFALGTLWTAELVYLLTLRSRTAYLAFFGAGIVLLLLWYRLKPSVAAGRQALVSALAVVALCSAIVTLHTPSRERLASAGSYLASPSTFLDSDRGVYLLNTINMAIHNPLGVGLGDWQTAYPLYRRVDRFRAFDQHHEVRRAHSDYVQFLGEGGWPGLLAWCLFLALLVKHTVTGKDPRRAAFETAQVVAFLLAMSTDYVVELPYSKFQFFCVLAIVLWRPPTLRTESPTEPRPTSNGLPAYKIAMVVILAVGMGELFYHVQLTRTIWRAAAIEAQYQRAQAAANPTGELAAIVREGPQFAASLGHTKTLYRAWLILGEAARLQGAPALAYAATARGVELHPYSPSALSAMARASQGRPESRQWSEAYRFVRDEAQAGFEGSYPGQGN